MTPIQASPTSPETGSPIIRGQGERRASGDEGRLIAHRLGLGTMVEVKRGVALVDRHTELMDVVVGPVVAHKGG